jgi:hypothetical protein
MSSAWTLAPSLYPLFNNWQRDTMRGLYFGLFAGPGIPNANKAAAGPMPFFGAGVAEAFGASVGTATAAAMEKLGDKLKESRAEERQEAEQAKTNKSRWSELTRNRILRCHGHDAITEWNEQNVAEIWGMYQQAMKEGTNSTPGIVKTFASTVFHKDPNVLDGERLHLSISTMTANCIKQDCLCPQPKLLLGYDNIDEGLMPLAFVRRESDEILEDTNQEEEYQRSNHRTLVEGKRARSGRSKVKKAPDTFTDTLSLLRGYAEVLKEHFTRQSVGFQGTNQVCQCLCRRQETWRYGWDATIGARFWWLFSRAIHKWMSPSEWGYGGIAPMMEIAPIIHCISSGDFPPQINMPIQLLKLGGLPPPGVQQFGRFNKPLQPPQQVANIPQIRSNPNVHLKIRHGVWPALEINGPQSSLRTLMNFGPAAGSQVKFVSTIINDAHCQEFVVAGKCVDRRCSRSHDPNYTPGADQIDKFL